MTLTINRLSASIATWSQVSPLRSSPGSLGLQFFSFLATKAHFSSNWTSRVFGGKSDEFVVKVAGVQAGYSAETADRATIDLAKSTRLADAASLADVVYHRLDLLRWKPGVEVRGPLPLGKTGLANTAPKHSPFLIQAVSTGHGQISCSALTMLGADGIEAAEAREVIHGTAPPLRS
jgi:hypothetical protein